MQTQPKHSLLNCSLTYTEQVNVEEVAFSRNYEVTEFIAGMCTDSDIGCSVKFRKSQNLTSSYAAAVLAYYSLL
jgi:hypothetical protein